MTERDTRQQRRDKILDAALQAYARYGIADATIRQIAELAGIGKSTVFEYFKSGEELMDAAFAHYIAQANAQWPRLHALAQQNAPAALCAYLDSITTMVCKEPDKLLLVSQYMTQLMARHSDHQDVCGEYAQKIQPMSDKLMAEFLFLAQEGIHSGMLKPLPGMDSRDCALLIMAIAQEMQSQALLPDEAAKKANCVRLKQIALRLLGADS